MSRFNYLILAALLIFLAAAAYSQTIVVPEPRPGHPAPLPYIQASHVSVEIDSALAKTTVELTVFNPGGRVAEGTLLFPLPANASVSDFYLWIGGKKVKGELLGKEQAAKIYRDIVRRMQDPALLEMTRFNVFKANIFPIEANKSRKVSITYSENLAGGNGLLHYSFLTKNRQLGDARPLDSFSFEAKIKSPVAITTAYSPSHEMEITRESENSMTAGFEKSNFNSKSDLHLYIGYSPDAMAVYSARYDGPGEDRDFAMFLLSPTPDTKENRRVEKDVVFVLDTSGSMQHDSKLSQAVKALSFGLHSLGEGDRFGLITFATSVRSLSDSLMPASSSNVDDADTYLARISATGSTNIHDALRKAFSMLGESERTRYIIFLTDGLPTAVERDPQKIIKRAGEWAPEGVRLFNWGVGYDVDTILLDTLASNHGGVSEYVKPSEEMESKLGGFFEKIAYPVMTDLSIEFNGFKVDEIFPMDLPDVFRGSQLTLFARISGGESGRVILSGNYLGQKQTFTYDLKPVMTEEGDHIAHLWAARKIGFLLDEIRRDGETAELKEAVIELATKYGIVTPYTSYLVTEPEEDMATMDNRPGIEPQVGGVRRDRVAQDAAAAPTARTGESAVKYSQEVRELKEEATASAEREDVRAIKGKTFVLKDGVWVDSGYKESMKTITVKFGEDDYFDLLGRDNRMASWLAIGKEVIIVFDNTAYKIIP